jgi:hypothetical protein
LIRFLEDSDKQKLKFFYDAAYGAKHILNNILHHDWQFKNNPFNKLSTKSILITESSSIIEAHLGFIPIELKLFEEFHNSSWHVSFFTLDQFRSKGFGTQLIEYGNNFFDFTLVLSGSDGTKKIYLNTNGKDFGNLNRYIGILDKKRIEDYLKSKIKKSKVKIFHDDNYKITRIDHLDKNYNQFWNDVRTRYPITVNRTKKYLNWRFLDHPLLDYHFLLLQNNSKILGFAVIRFENNNVELKAARLVDMIVFEKFEKILLNQIINYCFNKADFIDFFCTGSFYKESFLEMDFFNNLVDNLPFPSVFNPIDADRSSEINFFFKDNTKNIFNTKLDNIENFYFVKSDSDQDRPN